MPKLSLSGETKFSIAFTISAVGFCAYNDITLLSSLIATFPAWLGAHLATYTMGLE